MVETPESLHYTVLFVFTSLIPEASDCHFISLGKISVAAEIKSHLATLEFNPSYKMWHFSFQLDDHFHYESN
jgi:hypothetical protein